MAFKIDGYAILTGNAWGSDVGLMPFALRSPDKGSLVKVTGYDIAREHAYFTDVNGQDWALTEDRSDQWCARPATPMDIVDRLVSWTVTHEQRRGNAPHTAASVQEAVTRMTECRDALLDLLGAKH